LLLAGLRVGDFVMYGMFAHRLPDRIDFSHAKLGLSNLSRANSPESSAGKNLGARPPAALAQ
jgi:hypothetical protein